MRKNRLDELLIAQGRAQSKEEAFVLVTEGRVFVEGQKAISPSQLINPEARIEVRKQREYVGRGAYKLEAALEKFHINVKGKVCADIGSATGGFTEVLLKYGAKKVYAIDTARGKLAPKLREDRRVVVMEGVDVRDIETLPEKVQIVTMDVSLISLRNILSRLRVGQFWGKAAEFICLFKPQYETRDPKILRHGVVKNDAARERLLHDFIKWSERSGWEVKGQAESPIKGGEGNIEYLLWLRLS